MLISTVFSFSVPFVFEKNHDWYDLYTITRVLTSMNSLVRESEASKLDNCKRKIIAFSRMILSTFYRTFSLTRFRKLIFRSAHNLFSLHRCLVSLIVVTCREINNHAVDMKNIIVYVNFLFIAWGKIVSDLSRWGKENILSELIIDTYSWMKSMNIYQTICKCEWCNFVRFFLSHNEHINVTYFDFYNYFFIIRIKFLFNFLSILCFNCLFNNNIILIVQIWINAIRNYLHNLCGKNTSCCAKSLLLIE